jgi:hypothetical protein
LEGGLAGTVDEFIAEGGVLPVPNIETGTLEYLSRMIQNNEALLSQQLDPSLRNQNAVNIALENSWVNGLSSGELSKLLLACNYLDIDPLLKGISYVMSKHLKSALDKLLTKPK